MKLTSKDRNNENGFVGKNNTKIVVKDAKGKTLSLNKDYTIFKYEYVDNKTYKVLEDKNAAEPITDNRSELRIPDKNTYYTVKVTLKGAGENYTEDTLSAYYRIAYGKNSIKSAKFVINYDKDPVNNPGFENKYFYYKEGGTVTLNEDTLTVTLKEGSEEKTLVFGKDYKVVSYSKNDRKGTAKLIIEGQGEYVEQKVITFKIGAQDFFWWTQPTQSQNAVVSQDLISIMNEGIALSLAK